MKFALTHSTYPVGHAVIVCGGHRRRIRFLRLRLSLRLFSPSPFEIKQNVVAAFRFRKEQGERVQSHDKEFLHAFISQLLLATRLQKYIVQKHKKT